MSKNSSDIDFLTQSFESAKDFEAFLEGEHANAPGLYLKLAKKASGIKSITGAEAVETALCFGWIDGRANSIDENWFTVRYTPRRAKSIWSKKNVDTVGRLIEEGRMRPSGLVAVDAAKADGRWDRAYAGPATMEVPEDFQKALESEKTAKAFFDTLNKGDRYSVLWPVETATPTSRAGRIQAIIQMLAIGTVPGAESKAASKAKQRVRAKEAKLKKSSNSSSTKKPIKKLSQDSSKVKPSRREGLRRRL